MSFDPTLLVLSLVPGGIGFVLFTYGRKQQRLPHLVIGIAMVVYPYFVNSVLSMLGVGAVLGVALYLAVAHGW